MPVHDKVKQHAERMGAQTAVNIEGKTLSWKQLWLRALSFYAAMVKSPARGSAFAPGKVIAVALGNDLEFAPAWLAATANTHICAVIDPQLPLSQLDDVLARLAPDLLLVKGAHAALIEAAQRMNINVLPVEQVADAEASEAEAQAFIRHVDAATPFLINFTSGTTSTPKAFMRSRRSWRVSFRNGYDIFNLSSAACTLFPGPLFHGIGLYCLNEALDAGATLYCMEKWDAHRALALLVEHQIQRLVLVPTMLTAFSRIDAAALPCVTHLLSAGAKLEFNHYRQARAKFPNAGIQEYYGASELGFIAVSSLNDDNVDSALPTVGLPFPEVSWSIRDEQGQQLGKNQPGIIYLDSEQACMGYLWGDDGKAFKQQPFGSTVHDLGYINDQGRLHVIGRSGDMIVSGGNNIYLSEVESVLKSLPGIAEAVVLAVDDAYLGKKMVAFIETEKIDIATLPTLCLTQLAKYKIPAQFCKVSHWPLTPSGKIRRSVLEERFINHEIN